MLKDRYIAGDMFKESFADPYNQEECQFAKYGFKKPEFECEIWKESEGWLLGCVKYNDCWYTVEWDCDGKNTPSSNLSNDITGDEPDYDLKPLKKEWHEDKSNFPCLAFDKKHDKFTTLYTKYEVINADPERYRLAKKGEVLSLYKEV